MEHSYPLRRQLVGSAVLMTLGLASGAIAAEPPALEAESAALEQVTSVSQLSDVQPTDWAFQALQSLVERYGCIAGYPDGTYRGNRAMTRYEFAAGLNACLDRVNELIAAGTADLATREDLATLQRLQEEFAAELATLRGRVDSLEARTAELEANQFSTTTRLEGEAIFALTSAFDGDDAFGAPLSDNPTFSDRLRLNLETSFTGRDNLRTRLSTGNTQGRGDLLEGALAFEQDEANDIGLEVLLYSFPLGDNTEVTVAAAGGASDDFASTVNALDGDGASGAISAFGTRHPIYYPVAGAGVGVRHAFGDKLELSLGYLAGDANSPASGSGLFDGSYGALAQLVVKPFDRLDIGLTYVNAYSNNPDAPAETGTGSFLSNYASLLDVPVVTNSYGVELSWRLSDRFVVGGWAGYTNSRNLSTLNGTIDRGALDIWNWAVTLGFPDLGKEGNLGGIIVGMEPKVTDSSIEGFSEDPDTSLHLEAFYQYQLNENLSITPGVIWLTAPNHNSDNQDAVIGTLRTTFTF